VLLVTRQNGGLEGGEVLDGHDADARQQTHEDPQLPELELGEEGETGDV
jgi:hypothetical protein